MHSRFSYISNGILRGSDEFGVIAVYFGNATTSNLQSGQETSLKTEKAGKSLNWEILSQDYSKPISFALQICKRDFSPFEPEHERALSKFLCRRGEYGWLFIQDKRYADIWIRANISNPQIFWTNGVNGIQYTVTLDSSLAYSSEINHNFEIKHPGDSYSFFVNNDEQVLIYPDMVITVPSNGTLKITNSQELDTSYSSDFKNLTTNEVISIHHELPDITSSKSSHNIWNDFSLKFPRLYDGLNTLTFSLPCKVTLKYREHRRLVIF